MHTKKERPRRLEQRQKEQKNTTTTTKTQKKTPSTASLPRLVKWQGRNVDGNFYNRRRRRPVSGTACSSSWLGTGPDRQPTANWKAMVYERQPALENGKTTTIRTDAATPVSWTQSPSKSLSKTKISPAKYAIKTDTIGFVITQFSLE